MIGDRDIGKTTRLFEKAINILSTLPPEQRVFVTGAHPIFLRELERSFRESGLVDVMFFSVEQIMRGALDGCRGVLLIDDYADLSIRHMDCINEAQRKLNHRSIRR